MPDSPPQDIAAQQRQSILMPKKSPFLSHSEYFENSICHKMTLADIPHIYLLQPQQLSKQYILNFAAYSDLTTFSFYTLSSSLHILAFTICHIAVGYQPLFHQRYLFEHERNLKVRSKKSEPIGSVHRLC